MNVVTLTGKLETEPEIVTKNGKGQFFYFKLRVLNENETAFIKINCLVCDEKCVEFYSKCKQNDYLSITGSIVPSVLKVQNLSVNTFNVKVSKFEVIASAPAKYKPKYNLKDEYL